MHSDSEWIRSTVERRCTEFTSKIFNLDPFYWEEGYKLRTPPYTAVDFHFYNNRRRYLSVHT
jgi:hypothetical protein